MAGAVREGEALRAFSAKGDWKGRLERATGKGDWKGRLERATGRATGTGDWNERLERATGKGDWKGRSGRIIPWHHDAMALRWAYPLRGGFANARHRSSLLPHREGIRSCGARRSPFRSD